MSDIKEVLTNALALLQDNRRWTTGTLARDVRARRVSSFDPRAQRWCLEGSLVKVTGGDIWVWRDASDCVINACYKLFGVSPVSVNDELGHDAVCQVLHEAIRSL